MGNSSTWELKNFNIKNFETIELTTLENDLTKLFEVNKEWYENHTIESFIEEIRGDNE